MSDAPTFDEEQARRARLALREALGLGEETFPLAALVNMVGDEIGQLREAGRSDEDIARIIEGATGESVDADAMAGHLASSGERRG